MYLIKTPVLIQRLFPSFLWRLNGSQKSLFLTFDDGPIPGVTPWVLDTLSLYDAKATFFCVGDNVRKYPEIFRQIKANGHLIGNHSYNHLDGWATEKESYINNVRKCNSLVNSNLFRPPYGRICPGQSAVLQQDYTIVMWDVLSGDFDKRLTGYQCLQNVTDHAEAGSIIVFHDSLKAWDRLRVALPGVLAYFSQRGYTFKPLDLNVDTVTGDAAQLTGTIS